MVLLQMQMKLQVLRGTLFIMMIIIVIMIVGMDIVIIGDASRENVAIIDIVTIDGAKEDVAIICGSANLI
jgi:hypothetical protein